MCQKCVPKRLLRFVVIYYPICSYFYQVSSPQYNTFRFECFSVIFSNVSVNLVSFFPSFSYSEGGKPCSCSSATSYFHRGNNNIHCWSHTMNQQAHISWIMFEHLGGFGDLIGTRKIQNDTHNIVYKFTLMCSQ